MAARCSRAIPDVRLHEIGRLQSNKAADAVQLFDAIHSLDRPSLLDALVKEAEKAGRAPAVYIQVNIGEEEQKGGCAIDEIGALVEAVRASPLPLAGLMAIPPLGVEPAPYFALLAKLARRHDVTGLSIGMSADFKAAVMLGATAVRVGTRFIRGLMSEVRRDHFRLRRRASRKRVRGQPPARRAADRPWPSAPASRRRSSIMSGSAAAVRRCDRSAHRPPASARVP